MFSLVRKENILKNAGFEFLTLVIMSRSSSVPLLRNMSSIFRVDVEAKQESEANSDAK
jgi:hypothetical protein